MITRLKFHVLLAGLLTCSSVAWADGDLWTRSLEDAQKKAKEEGKSILMEFTGSDWCPPCKALTKNVFDTEAFKEEAPKDFVLLLLDFPNDKSKQTKEEIAQNKKLNEKYGISGFPTILLTDEQGRPFTKMVGYGGTPAEKYIEQLKEGAAAGARVQELFAEAEKAEGVAKARLFDQALDLIDSELVFASYGDTIEQIVALDAQNEAGLKAKYDEKLKVAQVKEQLADLQRSGKPDESLEKVQQLIAEMDLKGEALQEAMYYKGYFQFQTGDKDAAKTTLEAALKLAPESKMGQQIERILASAFK